MAEVDWNARVATAKTDRLEGLGGKQYRKATEDIDRVWHLLESPIEQIMLYCLMGANYSLIKGRPVYARCAPARGMLSRFHYPVQIIPQVEFGPYRVDFLIDFGMKCLAIECDGEAFHEADRDAKRDKYLSENFNVSVLRVRGKDIWRENSIIGLYIDVIRARAFT